MLDFSPLTLSDLPTVRPYLTGQGRICDLTPGIALMWRSSFDTQFAVSDNTLVLRLKCKCFDESYVAPLGENEDEVTDAIVENARRQGKRVRLRYMTEERALALSRRYGGEIDTIRKWSDYLYPAENFVSYPGKKLREKRNHMNRFLAEHPSWELTLICASNVHLARDFYLGYMSENEKDDPTARREAQICLEVLERWEDYGFFGGMLTDGGRIFGITAGEVIGDTLYVHIEKADKSVNGAYQMTASAFVRSFGGDVVFVNREDDSGDEGLRRSKLSYHPCMIVDKYNLTVE